MNDALEKYCIAILKEDRGGLGVDEKYVLIKVLLNFGLRRPVDKSVKELVRLFSMSEAVYRRARDSLIMGEFLVEERFAGEGKGRAIKGVVFSSVYLDKLEALVTQMPGDELIHQVLINELLESDGRWEFSELGSNSLGPEDEKVQVKQKDIAPFKLKLRPSTRILMCTLLAHANLVGVVSGLGYADLKKLTGMRKDKLISQLSKLKEVGFLKFGLPGLTGSRLLGVTKSEYLLNLEWDGFKDKVSPAVISLLLTPPWGKKLLNEASKLYEEARCLEKGEYKDAKDVEDVEGIPVRGFVSRRENSIPVLRPFECLPDLAKYFHDNQALRIEEMLQWKIEVYASNLLSKYWRQLSPNDSLKSNEVLEEIARIWLPEKYMGIEGNEGFLSLANQVELVHLIYELAHSIAVYVKSKLIGLSRGLRNKGLVMHQMQHILLPKASDRDLMSFCLLSYPNKGKVEDTFIVLYEEADEKNNNKTSIVESMDKVPAEVREKYRL